MTAKDAILRREEGKRPKPPKKPKPKPVEPIVEPVVEPEVVE